MESAGQLQQQPSANTEANVTNTSKRRRSRRHGRSREELHAAIEKLERLRTRWLLSASVLLVTCIGLGGGLVYTQSKLRDTRAAAEAQRERLEVAVRDNASRLSVAQRELRESGERIQALVAERIPGLRPVEMYSPLAIGAHFVRDITFQPVEADGRTGLEYKVVIENNSSAPLKPVIAVELFDEVGVQLAHSKPAEMSGDEPPVLRAGEIRSFFAVLETGRRGPAAYFRLLSGD